MATEPLKLTLGFSPCPNDTFIFDAMVHGKIDTEGLFFEVRMADVEELNQKAFKKETDIIKLSYHAYAYLVKDYVLLDAGSALGNNCGPILISKREIKEQEIRKLKIAIPGKYTTANFLLSLAFPDARNKMEMLFSEIEDAVAGGLADAGLIIHENRFTYEERGFKKIVDLGEFWEKLVSAPIPLGGIVIKRELPGEVQKKVNRVLKRSVEYALANPASSFNFVKENAREMSEEVRNKHISLYVNNYSVSLGVEGRKAVQLLFDKAQEKGLVPEFKETVFLND